MRPYAVALGAGKRWSAHYVALLAALGAAGLGSIGADDGSVISSDGSFDDALGSALYELDGDSGSSSDSDSGSSDGGDSSTC